MLCGAEKYFVVLVWYFVVQSNTLYYVVRVIIKKKVACEIEWKPQSIPIGAFFFWFICSLPFETSGAASCGTTGIGIQVEPGRPGAEVSKKNTISQRKNLPIECAQGDQPLRCPNRVF